VALAVVIALSHVVVTRAVMRTFRPTYRDLVQVCEQAVLASWTCARSVSAICL
jgi:hypothetical protein